MIYFRCDGNEKIGTGHVMRCLSIAEAARKEGEDSEFLLADEKCLSLITNRGFSATIFHTDYQSLNEEIPQITDFVQKNNVKNLFVDSYFVTKEYFSSLHKFCKITYIDDFGKGPWPVDSIINYSDNYEMFNYSKLYNNTNTKLLFGEQYTPLRAEFSSLPKKKISEEINTILLMSGGTDFYDAIDKILSVINKDFKGTIDVIYGMYYPNYDEKKNKYAAYRNIHFHKAVNDIDQYMKKADLAISAGGTSVKELYACGTPTIIYSIAYNQNPTGNRNKTSLAPFAGDIRFDNVPENVARLISEYSSKELRQNLSEQMQKKIDGLGAKRIYDIIR